MFLSLGNVPGWIQTSAVELLHMLFKSICRHHLHTAKACCFVLFCYCECQPWLVDLSFWDMLSLSLFPLAGHLPLLWGGFEAHPGKMEELFQKLLLKICKSQSQFDRGYRLSNFRFQNLFWWFPPVSHGSPHSCIPVREAMAPSLPPLAVERQQLAEMLCLFSILSSEERQEPHNRCAEVHRAGSQPFVWVTLK